MTLSRRRWGSAARPSRIPAVRRSFMKSTYSVSEAQSQLPRILKEVQKGGPVSIRRHDETVAYLVSRERMEAIVETLEILGSRSAMRAIEQHRAGKTKFLPLSAIGQLVPPEPRRAAAARPSGPREGEGRHQAPGRTARRIHGGSRLRGHPLGHRRRRRNGEVVSLSPAVGGGCRGPMAISSERSRDFAGRRPE